MDHHRYDYSPVIKRERLVWPDGARVALWVCPNIEYFYIDKPIRAGLGAAHLPDVRNYSLRDYGSRVGLFRLMEVLDKHEIRASVLLNADVCRKQPVIIAEGNKRRWEWLGHGMTNNMLITDYPPGDQQKVIREVTEIIASAAGIAPKGWLGPGLAESFSTPDLLAAEGYEYLCDWGCDDQPVSMRVKSGRMIAMPYDQGLNDINVFLRSLQTPEQYLRMLCDQFDVLYEEGAKSGRVMAIPLHPFIIGLPFRIKALDRALEYIGSHRGVWRATGREIAEWFFQNGYRNPGRPVS